MSRPRPAPAAEPERFLSAFRRVGPHAFEGHAFAPAEPGQRFVVEILVDDEPVAWLCADRFSRHLAGAGGGDGCSAFSWLADPALLRGASTVSARIANGDVPVGAPIGLRRDPIVESSGEAGSVSWTAGLRLFGAVALDGGHAPPVKVFEHGRPVAEARPAAASAEGGLVPFSLHVPDRFADGRPHSLRVEDGQGRELEGSPVVILALERGLAGWLPPAATPLDALRAERFDRLFPSSVPFADYPRWRAALPAAGEAEPVTASIRVVVIGEATDPLDHAPAGWRDGTAPSRVAVPSVDGRVDPDDLRGAALAHPAADVVVFCPAGAELKPGALASLADALRRHPEADLAHGDLEIGEGDVATPVFFGAFDRERMLEQGYAAQVFAARGSALTAAFGQRPDTRLSLFLALLGTDAPQTSRVVHRPGIVARIPRAAPLAELAAATRGHLARRAVEATLTPLGSGLFPALRVSRRLDRPRVSVVIPTRDRSDLLGRCVSSLRARTAGVEWDLVIVDNGSADPASRALLGRLATEGATILHAPGPFNFSRLANAGVAVARHDLVCLLNNDTEALHDDWLAELASRAAEPDCGAVGATLLWPNGCIQHGGIVLGPGLAAADAFNDHAADDAGHGDILRVARQTSAVTAACLLVRRDLYGIVGGFDEVAFPVLFNDVDFCLRLRDRGRRVVVTPHARLLHHESATRGRDEAPSAQARFRRELGNLRARWGAVLADDPCYSPFLNGDAFPFSGLAAPVRPIQDRTAG